MPWKPEFLLYIGQSQKILHICLNTMSYMYLACSYNSWFNILVDHEVLMIVLKHQISLKSAFCCEFS